MIAEGREWHKTDGASAEALAALQTAVPVELPAEYLALLAYSNGGEGPLAPQPYYFQLDSAEYAAEVATHGTFAASFAGFVMIGSNGGGEHIALDARGPRPPWPVVAIDMVAGPETAMLIAPTFAAFVDLIGGEGE